MKNWAEPDCNIQSPKVSPVQPLLDDPYLQHFRPQIEKWQLHIEAKEKELCKDSGSLTNFALGHLFFGLQREHKNTNDNIWVLREWGPNAVEMYLYGDATDWQLLPEYRFEKIDEAQGIWQLRLYEQNGKTDGVASFERGQYFALWLRWQGGDQGAGEGRRLPSYVKRVVQDPVTKIFSAQFSLEEYQFTQPRPNNNTGFYPIIYEAHVGMAQEYDNIGSYHQFTHHILPYIARLGYNTVQLMGIQEHPYYGSFGYHVANPFAVSSRFGTQNEFKALVDEAHRLGLRIIIDLVHSHHVRNEEEGLGYFAGQRSQYFYPGGRGEHEQWNSYVYDYGKNEVIHYLLSNLQFWLSEYNIDGFRFDGVTSMLYEHRGMGCAFARYDDYFNGAVDNNALVYLALANRLIHELHPEAISLAEDVSGLPGLASPDLVGFNYRLAMGVTDYWFKLLDIADENWNMFALWHELSQGRNDERTVSYVESHDQALVGGKSFIFTMIDSDMYWHMDAAHRTLRVDRGLALHKMARLITLASARHGYLNFMGNEFGHPEWIDFPREGNDWSYNHSRRLWSLAFREDLLFKGLRLFEEDMQALFTQEAIMNHTIDWLHLYDHDKIICFRRGTLLFVFNFHPTQFFTDYRIPAPGTKNISKYTIALCSDSPSYSGFGLVAEQQMHFVQQDQNGSFIQVYLPPRVALVLKLS